MQINEQLKNKILSLHAAWLFNNGYYKECVECLNQATQHKDLRQVYGYLKRFEKDLRPYNATRYSLYGNRRSGKSRGGVEPLLSCKYVHGKQEG